MEQMDLVEASVCASNGPGHHPPQCQMPYSCVAMLVQILHHPPHDTVKPRKRLLFPFAEDFDFKLAIMAANESAVLLLEGHPDTSCETL